MLVVAFALLFGGDTYSLPLQWGWVFGMVCGAILGYTVSVVARLSKNAMIIMAGLGGLISQVTILVVMLNDLGYFG